MICHEHDCAPEIARLRAEAERLTLVLGQTVADHHARAEKIAGVLRPGVDRAIWAEPLERIAEAAINEIGDRGQIETDLTASLQSIAASLSADFLPEQTAACEDPRVYRKTIACAVRGLMEKHLAACAEIAEALREIPIEQHRFQPGKPPVTLLGEVRGVMAEWHRCEQGIERIWDLCETVLTKAEMDAAIAAPQTPEDETGGLSLVRALIAKMHDETVRAQDQAENERDAGALARDVIDQCVALLDAAKIPGVFLPDRLRAVLTRLDTASRAASDVPDEGARIREVVAGQRREATCLEPGGPRCLDYCACGDGAGPHAPANSSPAEAASLPVATAGVISAGVSLPPHGPATWLLLSDVRHPGHAAWVRERAP
jgi:hypothetical protein